MRSPAAQPLRGKRGENDDLLDHLTNHHAPPKALKMTPHISMAIVQALIPLPYDQFRKFLKLRQEPLLIRTMCGIPHKAGTTVRYP